MPQNRASSARKMYSKIALVQLCGIAINQIRRVIYVSKDLNRQTDYSFANQRCYVFIGIGWGAMLAVDAACAILALESPVFCRINAFPLGSIYLCSFVCRQRSMQSYSIACYPCPRSRSKREISERATSKGVFRFQSVFRLESQFGHHVISLRTGICPNGIRYFLSLMTFTCVDGDVPTKICSICSRRAIYLAPAGMPPISCFCRSNDIYLPRACEDVPCM